MAKSLDNMSRNELLRYAQGRRKAAQTAYLAGEHARSLGFVDAAKKAERRAFLLGQEQNARRKKARDELHDEFMELAKLCNLFKMTGASQADVDLIRAKVFATEEIINLRDVRTRVLCGCCNHG